MGEKDKGTAPGPLRVETVRGEPYHVGGRTLIPVARLVTYGRASATIASDRVGSWGGGFVQVIPVAVVEETAEGERPIAVTDATSAALRGLLGTAVAATLFFAAVRWLVRRLHRASVEG
jgi:uncharacterized spore protein YtfJ